MAATTNAIFLLAAICFFLVSYLTNWAVQTEVDGMLAHRKEHAPRIQRIYHFALWLTFAGLLGLVVHLTLRDIMDLGLAVSLASLPVAIVMAVLAGWMLVVALRAL